MQPLDRSHLPIQMNDTCLQSLATPEWARKDWFSPPNSAARQQATPRLEQEDLPSSGKPLGRGQSGRTSVARRLNIEPVGCCVSCILVKVLQGDLEAVGFKSFV